MKAINVELIPPKQQEVFEIRANGKQIGTVSTAPEPIREKYKAVINITDSARYEAGLAQGYGDTPEKAIDNAFKTSKQNAQKYINNLEELQIAFFG